MSAIIAAIATWNWMSADVFLHQGSPQAPFLGLGIGKEAIVMVLLYGVVQTGFTEEVFFRGMIGGAVMRRFGFWRGNVLQSLIFLGPHLFLLVVMPEQWKILPVIFAGALWGGWLLHKSGSFVGPWIIHAAANVTTCLLAAASITGKQVLLILNKQIHQERFCFFLVIKIVRPIRNAPRYGELSLVIGPCVWQDGGASVLESSTGGDTQFPAESFCKPSVQPSTLHRRLHPSPSTVLPSSQVSPPVMRPSPQTRL